MKFLVFPQEICLIRLKDGSLGMTDSRIQEVVNELKKQIFDHYNLNAMSDEQLEQTIEKLAADYFQSEYVTIEERVDISERIFNSIRGLGLLDTIIKDEQITEVMINGPDDIFIEKAGKLHKLNQKFESERQLEDIIQKIVGQAGREVNQANPIVDTRLPDGSRVNVVLPPISMKGATVTIRKFSKSPMTVEQLLKYGSITPEVAHVLELLVKAKYNIFISGGTGSGKTTFLNALSNFIPKDERVITIEDSAELQITGIENLVSMETRNANASGSGAITIRDLIKSSLRMRPERIVVGEVRGGEALDMLQAMNTGHDGSLSTGHANSTKDMLSRLETMVLQGAEGLPLEAIRQQIASAVDIIVHLSRLRDKSRKTMEICEITGYENGKIQINCLYEFVEDKNSTLEKVSGKLIRTSNPFIKEQKLRLSGIQEVI
jgi:pilus assembly protein CpaF